MNTDSKKVFYIASDHAGWELKKKIQEHFDFQFEDFGPESSESVDYPDYAHKLCQKLIHPPKEENISPIGILICGSGQGMAMTANKYPEIRAALCWTEEGAKLSRQHNDANVLCLASRLVDLTINLKIIKAFVETPFEGGRHQNRIKKIPTTSN